MAKSKDNEEPKEVTKEEVQKTVMEILEITINDWDKPLTTEEGLERLKGCSELDKKKPPISEEP